MKKVGLFLLLIIVGLCFVSAHEKRVIVFDELGNTNITYGQCLKDSSHSAEDCVGRTTIRFRTCKESVNNGSNITANFSYCKELYDKGRHHCSDFHKQEKLDCKKIKHSFWERLRYLFS